MEQFLIKKPRLATQSGFRQIATGRSKFARFNTTQYVTRFIIENLGEDPEHELGLIMGGMIDQANENTKKEYGQKATMFNVLIDGHNLNQPISVSIRDHIPGLDVEIVSLQLITIIQ